MRILKSTTLIKILDMDHAIIARNKKLTFSQLLLNSLDF